MNPKTPQDLDPKLKEAYERVMSGNQGSPLSSSPSPLPKTESAPLASQTPPPSIPLTNPNVTPQPTPTTVQSPSIAPLGANGKPLKKKMKISPIIFLVIGLGFFVAYALVWGKIFNLF